MSDSSYVAVHTQAWQSYVTVHNLLRYGYMWTVDTIK